MVVGHHLLLLGDFFHGPDAVPVAGGPLKVQLLRRLVHLLGQKLHRLHAAPLHKGQGLLEGLGILLRGDLAGANPHALLDVEVEAGTALAAILRKAAGAGGQQEGPVGLVHRLLHHHGGGVGTDVGHLLFGLLHLKGDAGVGAGGDAHVKIPLGVLQEDVILGGVELYQAGLQHQGLKLAVGDDVIKVPDVFHHAVDLNLVLVHRAEIGGDPVFQGLGLADVDNLPLGVLHDVDPWLLGQQLGPLVEGLHHRLVHHPPSPLSPLLVSF